MINRNFSLDTHAKSFLFASEEKLGDNSTSTVWNVLKLFYSNFMYFL